MHCTSFFQIIPRKRTGHKAGLCWQNKKLIPGCFNLHERSGKERETTADKAVSRQQRDCVWTEPFSPMQPVRTYDGRNGILINEVLSGKDAVVAALRFVAVSDRSLYLHRDLWIRNDGRKKDCVRMAANAAENTWNVKADNLVLQPDLTAVSAIPNQTAWVAAGTGYLGKLKRKNDFVIQFLRNRVAKIRFNGYHRNVHGVSHVFCDESRVRTLVGESPAFCFVVTNRYDNTKSPRIKQFDG